MSNNTNRVNNPMKVITGPDTRWSYANVWEPKSINGGTPKYSVSLIIPKSDTKTVAKIKAAIEAAYQEGQAKLKGNGRSVPPLSAIKTPLRLPPGRILLRSRWMSKACSFTVSVSAPVSLRNPLPEKRPLPLLPGALRMWTATWRFPIRASS